MPASKTESATFNSAAYVAESTRAVGVANAAGSGALKQANVNGVEITYYRTLISQALATGISPSTYLQALKSLGVQT
jgi:hypothetical protein